MAVEPPHPNLFSSQLTHNGEMMMNPMDASINLYHNNYSSLIPLSGTTTATTSETLLHPPPPYNSIIADSFPHQKTITAMKSDVTTLSYNNNNNNIVPVSRKRSIDSILYSLPYHNNRAINLSFLNEDMSFQIHHQQLHLDNLVSQHMEKVRMELEEKRKRQARMLMEVVELGMMKKLKTKEEEMEKIEKLNYALEEKIKSLCIENQIWRDLAQTNEATVNALRTNLIQVLSQARDDDGEHGRTRVVAVVEEAESRCGSNDENEGWRMIGGSAQDKEMGEECSGNGRLCRKCGKDESCVLILPCRHLCLCNVCASTLNTCPICNSFKNATLLVNLT
ncbi:hypothetical protein Lal_00019099 [Lupinus albus]|uniref:Putative transcription factor C2H2 family n=1 Tax=Lupinus albus TaxID=3870 RepID=A0A6A5PPZ7_LUPAL|nr:putative transcription factor C2H2 family [Lupinus albus]KAF1898978.1 hypothetical protein Lal_00019099 [Lupinus albus]